MKNKKLVKYFKITAIPLIILCGMTVLPLLTLLFGEEILLETVPVDPRDLFRGDYVTLDYKISQIDGEYFSKFIPSDDYWSWEYQFRKQPIYVALEEKNGYYEVKDVFVDKPLKEGHYLKATIRYIDRDYNQKMEENTSEYGKMNYVVVDYQLDKYFVPENTGLELEEASRSGTLTAKAKVFRGYALLTDIIIKL